MPSLEPQQLKLLLLAAITSCFAAFALLIWGFVPDEVDEDEIFGYRLNKRKRLLEENDLYRMVMPAIKIFAHHIRKIQDSRFWEISKTRSGLRDKLMRSGYMGAFTPNEFMGLCCVSSIGMFLAFCLLTFLMTDAPQIPVALIFSLVGLYMPVLSLNGRITERLIEIDRRLPYAVDLLVLSMRAGLDFMTALDRVVTRGQEQNPDDPIIQELSLVLQEMRVGTARTDALINLCERVKSDYLASMVGSIIQSEKRGTPLATVLEVLVDTIRNKRTQKIEKLASEAAVKILLPLMFIFGAVIVVVIGAMGLRIMQEGQ